MGRAVTRPHRRHLTYCPSKQTLAHSRWTGNLDPRLCNHTRPEGAQTSSILPIRFISLRPSGTSSPKKDTPSDAIVLPFEVKGWVLAMLARQLADCAWLTVPAGAAFDLRLRPLACLMQIAPRNIGPCRSLQGTLEKPHMRFCHACASLQAHSLSHLRAPFPYSLQYHSAFLFCFGYIPHIISDLPMVIFTSV